MFVAELKKLTPWDNEGKETERLIKFYWKWSLSCDPCIPFSFVHQIMTKNTASRAAQFEWCRAAGITVKQVSCRIFPISDWSGVTEENQLGPRIKAREYKLNLYEQKSKITFFIVYSNEKKNTNRFFKYSLSIKKDKIDFLPVTTSVLWLIQKTLEKHVNE